MNIFFHFALCVYAASWSIANCWYKFCYFILLSPLQFIYPSISFIHPFHLSIHFIYPSISFIYPFHLSINFIYLSISFILPFHLYIHFVFSSISFIPLFHLYIHSMYAFVSFIHPLIYPSISFPLTLLCIHIDFVIIFVFSTVFM